MLSSSRNRAPARIAARVEGVGLDLDGDVRERGADRADRGRDTPGRHDVVVLDHRHVVQPHPLVRPTPAPNRVLLELAQPGRGLSRVEDERPGALQGVDPAPGVGGDPARSAREVQQGPLRDQDHLDRPGDHAEHLSGVHPIAVGDVQLDQRRRQVQPRGHLTEDLVGRSEARDHAVRTRHQVRDTRLPRFDRGLGRHVTPRVAAQILVEGARHRLSQPVRIQPRPHVGIFADGRHALHAIPTGVR